jgi:hypothetical protein
MSPSVRPIDPPIEKPMSARHELIAIGTLSAFEQQAMVGMLDTLKGDITLGEEFVNK